MIPITEEQYAAIGKVAVESGTLEHEVAYYIKQLGTEPHRLLGQKLKQLRKIVSPYNVQFDVAIDLIETLLAKRNAVIHGVWSLASNAPIAMGEITATQGKLTLHAREITQVAAKLRTTRKLLLALCHDYCPQAVNSKRRPAGSVANLFKKATS